MKWEEDLTKDIRYHDERDDHEHWKGEMCRDRVPRRPATWPGNRARVGAFSVPDGVALKKYFERVNARCNFIMEIGVDKNSNSRFASSNILLTNKLPETTYLGIDIDPKTHLHGVAPNVHTLQSRSEDFDRVYAKLNELGVKEIDFLFIDGYHSINQVLLEWEYTSLLSEHGIVGIHDTRYHPGPHLFIKHLDRSKWEVEDGVPNVPANEDYGIHFVWRKNGDA